MEGLEFNLTLVLELWMKDPENRDQRVESYTQTLRSIGWLVGREREMDDIISLNQLWCEIFLFSRLLQMT